VTSPDTTRTRANSPDTDAAPPAEEPPPPPPPPPPPLAHAGTVRDSPPLLPLGFGERERERERAWSCGIRFDFAFAFTTRFFVSRW
jgi:hypothetical protein